MSAEQPATDPHPHVGEARADADPASWRTNIAVADLVSAIANRSPAARRAAVSQLVALGFVEHEVQRLDAAADMLLQTTRSITNRSS